MKGFREAQAVVTNRLTRARQDIDLGDLVELADKAGYEAGRQTPLYQDRLDYQKTLPPGFEIYWNEPTRRHRVRKL